MIDHVRHGQLLMIEVKSSETEATLSNGWEAAPADRAFEQSNVFNAREDNALCADVERACDQRILKVRHAHDRGEIHEGRDAAELLDSLEVEAAVLCVDERPVEARLREDL